MPRQVLPIEFRSGFSVSGSKTEPRPDPSRPSYSSLSASIAEK